MDRWGCIISTVKEDLRRLVDELPEDVTWDEVQHRLYVRQQIAWSLEDLAAGRVVNEDEAEERLLKWQDPPH
jgi:predicted transcriptional regulator